MFDINLMWEKLWNEWFLTVQSKQQILQHPINSLSTYKERIPISFWTCYGNDENK